MVAVSDEIKLDIPVELEMGFDCLRFQTLPEAGGLYDQLAGDVEKMTAAINTHTAVGAWWTAMCAHTKMGSWQARNRSTWKIACHWLELEQSRKKGEWAPHSILP